MATEVRDQTDTVQIGEVKLSSRLIHGTGKFSSNAVLAECLRQAEPSLVTLAVRRLGLQDGGQSELADVDLSSFTLLPNTAGATTVEQAVRLARLGGAAGLSDLVKVEVIGDDETLLPELIGMVKSNRFAWIGGGRHRTGSAHRGRRDPRIRPRRRRRRPLL